VAKNSDNSDSLGASDASASEETKANKTVTQPSEQQSAPGKTFGDDGFRYPQLEFPATTKDLNTYNKSVSERIEKKYETLAKNVHFYLAYLFLETGDFRNAVKHGELVLKQYEGRLLKKTQFTVMQYLAEAYCMLDEEDKALKMLDGAQAIMEAGRSRAEEDQKLTVEMLTTKLMHGDKLPTRTIVGMNRAAILLCTGDLIGAKTQLNQLLNDQNLRVV